jgi:hypothetical protein
MMIVVRVDTQLDESKEARAEALVGVATEDVMVACDLLQDAIRAALPGVSDTECLLSVE